MSNITKFSTSITMNSLEIADLLNCRHDKVKQSIERLANKGVIEFPPLGSIKTATKPATVIEIQKENGQPVSGEALKNLFAYFEDKHGYTPGSFEKLMTEAETSEAARWEIMLASDFHLFPTVPEVAA